MKIAILDDYFNTLRTLRCFRQLDDHDVTIWNDQVQDVDSLADKENVLIAGVMEHIEEAGVHSGDSSCVLPAHSIGRNEMRVIEDYTVRLALALNVIGLMNVQYAIKEVGHLRGVQVAGAEAIE